jgi:hypothetical protein
MSRAWLWIISGAVAMVVSAILAAPGHAQKPIEYTIGVHGGGAIFTEFLEQRADGGERELVAKTSPVIGGSISLSRWVLSEGRLSVDWTGTEIEFRDDTGDGSDELDEDGLADLNLVVAQLAVVQYVITPDHTFVPYITLGFNVAFWALDEIAGGVVGAEDETQVRYGATAGVGGRFAINPRTHLRVEIDRTTLGNPFDGESAFRIGGDTFDEPSVVGVLRLMAGVTYKL